MSFFRKKEKDVLTTPALPQKATVALAVGKEVKKSLPRILIYGTERVRVGVEHPNHVVACKEFELTFSSFHTTDKFQAYDGVILFQSTFETIRNVEPAYSSSYLDLKYDRDELVRRQNELSQLLEKGGFICFLIHSNFIDYTKYNNDLKHTDLCKLNLGSFYRNDLDGDYEIYKIYRSEFTNFLKSYGIAKVKFDYHNDWLEKNVRKVCGVNDYNLTGFILLDNRYFIPCRLPSKDEAEDFFKTLASALIATSKKLTQEIPSWVDEYKFKEEEKILDKEAKLQKQIEDLSSKKDIFKGYKRSLCYDGELLAESVTDILKEGLGLTLDNKKDEHLEDKAILDDKGNEIALIEIKGSNENIKNPNIYQTDSHRGRREKPADFPSILIVNTFIKPSNSIKDKLRDIGAEQIKLAVDKKVLVMRSIDLLNLLYLKEENMVTKEEIISILTQKCGWLCVSQDKIEIRNN